MGIAIGFRGDSGRLTKSKELPGMQLKVSYPPWEFFSFFVHIKFKRIVKILFLLRF